MDIREKKLLLTKNGKELSKKNIDYNEEMRKLGEEQGIDKIPLEIRDKMKADREKAMAKRTKDDLMKFGNWLIGSGHSFDVIDEFEEIVNDYLGID